MFQSEVPSRQQHYADERNGSRLFVLLDFLLTLASDVCFKVILLRLLCHLNTSCIGAVKKPTF